MPPAPWLNASDQTGPRWRSATAAVRRASARSHSTTLPSAQPAASVLPSGANASAVTCAAGTVVKTNAVPLAAALLRCCVPSMFDVRDLGLPATHLSAA